MLIFKQPQTTSEPEKQNFDAETGAIIETVAPVEAPKKAPRNVEQIDIIEDYLNENYTFRYNTLKNAVEAKKRAEQSFVECNANSILRELLKFGIKTNDKMLKVIFGSDFIAEYNPIQDYLANLPAWDG